MEITEKNPIQINPYVNQVQQNAQAAETEGEKGRVNVGEDSVELSQSARDLQKAQKALQDLPDIREDKVAALKQQIENGTYDIRADKIAANMLKESLSNDIFSSPLF
ncbi:MAG: flagellar biosynthesis anti-sigma factor FlgM [Desulfobacterales bacterium]|jgi:negative regulator of flagellin synthesis FlgM